MTLDPSVLQKVTFLRTSRADETVVRDLETSLEARCVVDAVVALHEKQWVAALYSACFALLISGPVDLHTMKLRLAFQALSGGGWPPDAIDSIDVIREPAFEVARQAIKSAEALRLLSAQEARFRQLDASGQLAVKQFDELLQLADSLESRGTGPGPGVRFRLTREREALQRLIKIQEVIASLSIDTDHGRRMEKIRTEVWPQVTEAVDLASGLHTRYGREIAESVSAVEEILSAAANEAVMVEITRNAEELRQAALASLRGTLRTQGDVVQTIETICRSFCELRETPAVDGVLGQSRHWLKERGRHSYDALIMRGDGHARDAVSRSRQVLERNRQDLPDEFAKELSALLTKVESRLGPVPPSPEPPQPEPPASGVFVRLRAIWGRYFS